MLNLYIIYKKKKIFISNLEKLIFKYCKGPTPWPTPMRGGPTHRQGQKCRKNRPKNRRKIVFRWASKRKTRGKFDCQKNRQKIGFIGDFSPKNRNRTKNRWKDRLWSTRAGRRVGCGRSRRKIGENSNLSPINRRYIGRFVGRIQATQI